MDILQYINKMNRLYGNDPTPVRFNTQKYLQGGRVQYKPGGLVEPRVGFYKGRLVTRGKNEGKWAVDVGGREGVMHFDTKPQMDKWLKTRPGGTPVQTAKAVAASIYARERETKELMKVRKKIDTWTKNWLDKNINKYEIRELKVFKEDLAKAWQKELKASPKKYVTTMRAGQPFKSTAIDGFSPHVSDKRYGKTPFKYLGEEVGDKLTIKTFWNKIFYHNQLKDKTFKKKTLDWMNHYIAGKAHVNQYNRKAYEAQTAKLLDDDVIYFLSKDSGLDSHTRKAVMERAFPEANPKFRAKLDKMSNNYRTSEGILDNYFGTKNILDTASKAEHQALAKIFDVSELPKSLKLNYNMDHIYGVSEAVREIKKGNPNKKFVQSILNNVWGMTKKRNEDLGTRWYSFQRKNLATKIEKGINAEANLQELNKLTKKAYGVDNAYQVVKGNVRPTKSFVGQTQPERFASYFKEIAKTKEGSAAIKKQYGNLDNLLKTLKTPKGPAKLKAMQFVIGTIGTAAAVSLFDTFGITPATAATPKHELIEGAKEKGLPMPTIKETVGALGLSKLSGKVGGPDPFKYFRKVPRKILSSLLTPTGALAAWPLAAMGAEKLSGEEVPVFDPKDPWSRGALGLELALAPELVKWTDKLTKPIKNQALRSGVQKGLNLLMNPKTAMRAARYASPVGWAALGLEGAYQGGKFMYKDYQKRKDAIETMWKEDPEKMQQLALEASETMRDDKSAMFNTGGRVPFGKGKLAVTTVDKGRRAFMKWLAGLTGAGVAAGTGLIKFGKIFGKGETVIKAGDHIIQGTKGMPDWFIPLVNRIVNEGTDVTKKLGTVEREIVHTKKIGKDVPGQFADEVTVYQDINTGNVRVIYESPHNMGEAPIHLEYRAGEVITEGKHAGKKTKSEFEAAEIEPVGRQVGPDDSTIEWDGENLVGKVEDLTSDTSKLKQFATKKKPTMKEIVESQKKKKEVEYYKTSEGEGEYVINKQGEGPIDGDEMFDEFGNYIGDD